MDVSNIQDLLVLHEALRLKPYQDSVGKLTIGVGRNLDDVGISRETAFSMLREDISAAFVGARWYPWFAGLNVVRQAVVVDMIFNMGRGKFRASSAGFRDGDPRDEGLGLVPSGQNAWAALVSHDAHRGMARQVKGARNARATSTVG